MKIDLSYANYCRTNVRWTWYFVVILTAIQKELLSNFSLKGKLILQMKLFKNVCIWSSTKTKYLFFLFLVNRFRIPITQPYDFVSAYGTPKFTNYTDDFKGCLDYIFFEKSKMSIIQTVPLPIEGVLSANIALPSKYFPSDHLALIADLKLLKQ